MIEAGAAGVHFEDQLSSEKKCGHLGGKVCWLISSIFKQPRVLRSNLDKQPSSN